MYVTVLIAVKLVIFCSFQFVKDVGCFQIYIYILYYVGGYFISSAPTVHVTPLKTPFALVIPLLQSQSHVTTITHNYLLRCYAFTQL
jgi:hypothetical protein